MFIDRRRFLVIAVTAVLTAVSIAGSAQEFKTRRNIGIPDIPGYTTLKCDFHMHTVFSDGLVWPTVRVAEAWLEGLDAIAITDHLEYKPHKDITADHNRPYEIAKPAADQAGLILIRGTEITKQVPPGHFNAIFITDANPIKNADYTIAIKTAVDQGGFVFYNHPDFRTANGLCYWGPEHDLVYEKGWLNGIEVVNGNSYYVPSHRWATEKKLTMFANTDTHQPITFDYDFANGEHRPMTFVFATERSADAIKHALVERRTAVWFKDTVAGEEQFLAPMFDAAVEMMTKQVSIRGTGSATVTVANNSELTFRLVPDDVPEQTVVGSAVTLYPGRTARLTIRGTGTAAPGTATVGIPYRVATMLAEPQTPLAVKLPVNVTFVSAAASGN